MNIPIKIKRHDVGNVQQLFKLMFQINLDFIDYVRFYNISNILAKIQKINFNLNFREKKEYTLNLSPNEAKEFLDLVKESGNLIQQNAYFTGIILEFTNDIHKQLSTLESQKNTLANNLMLTIPKSLNR